MIEPVLILPEGIYDDGALQQTLGLTAATLANARRIGSLRYSRQGKRVLYRGAWVLSWLETQIAPGDSRPASAGR
jgi:hypothetical protein